MKSDIGPLVAEYRGKSISSFERVLFYIPASMASVAMLANGFWQYYYGYSNYGPAAAQNWSLVWLVLASVIASLILIILLLRLSVARRYIAVHEKGIYFRLSTIKKKKVEWSSIKGIAAGNIRESLFGYKIGNRFQARVVLEKNRSIDIHQRVQNSRDLVDKLKSNIYPRLLPVLTEKMQTNQWLSFGRIAISRGGIMIKRRYIPWESITNMSVQSGFLVVELQPTGKARMAVVDIYNFEMLLHLIHEHVSP